MSELSLVKGKQPMICPTCGKKLKYGKKYTGWMYTSIETFEDGSGYEGDVSADETTDVLEEIVFCENEHEFEALFDQEHTGFTVGEPRVSCVKGKETNA